MTLLVDFTIFSRSGHHRRLSITNGEGDIIQWRRVSSLKRGLLVEMYFLMHTEVSPNCLSLKLSIIDWSLKLSHD